MEIQIHNVKLFRISEDSFVVGVVRVTVYVFYFAMEKCSKLMNDINFEFSIYYSAFQKIIIQTYDSYSRFVLN